MNGALDAFDQGLHALGGLFGVGTRVVHTALGDLRVYEATGRGRLPPLVLIHGLAAGSAAQFVPYLLAGRGPFRRVIAPDLPGHGGSPPLPVMDTPSLYAAVVAALDEVLDEPPVVYGNSLGGAVALHYGLVRPTRALVLASPAGTPLRDDLLQALLTRLLVRDEVEACRLLGSLHEEPALWARLIAADVRVRFEQPHIRALVSSVRNEHGFTPDMLRGLAAPALMVWGATDHLLPLEMLAYYRAYLPARFERPRGVGHVPHVEAPWWMWQRLVAFARECIAEATPGDNRR